MLVLLCLPLLWYLRLLWLLRLLLSRLNRLHLLPSMLALVELRLRLRWLVLLIWRNLLSMVLVNWLRGCVMGLLPFVVRPWLLGWRLLLAQFPVHRLLDGLLSSRLLLAPFLLSGLLAWVLHGALYSVLGRALGLKLHRALSGDLDRILN